MVALVNSSNYPAFGFEHKLLVGNPYYIVILKQSFKLEENGQLQELDEQIDIRLQDIAKDNPRWTSIDYPSDLIPYKPKPEIILNGIAQNGHPEDKWICGLNIKQLTGDSKISTWSKQILVTGERYWLKKGNGWELSEIQPTSSVDLKLENAYGGHFLLKANSHIKNSDNQVSPTELSYSANPSGKGWLPDQDSVRELSPVEQKQWKQTVDQLKVLPAPQLFNVTQCTQKMEDKLDTPYHAVPVAGFGAYANFWQMRTQYLDEDLDWNDESAHGGYPENFDMRHWQQAPSDQWLDFKLKGNEILTLTGFFAEGKQSYTLPTSIAYVVIREPEKLLTRLDMNIDTLVIDTQKRTLEIVWRRIILISYLDSNTIIECNAFTTNNFLKK